MKIRTCTICDLDKEISHYHKSGKNRWRSQCKPCYNMLLRENYCPRKHRNRKLKFKYGITHKEYIILSKAQDNKCKICASDNSKCHNSNYMHVDHCHETGKIRGLLCVDCNHGLGKFKDSPELLLNAISYLED